MPSETSIEDVVETHRQHLKAKRLHVTTGPSATPERIAETFARINATATYWGAFSALEREQAKVARLRAGLRRVASRCARPLTSDPKDLEARLNDIFAEADLVPDVDMVRDIAWMEERRARQGLAFPDGRP